MPKLGTCGNMTAPETGAVFECVVEGPGMAGIGSSGSPPGAASQGCTGLATTRARASRAVQLCHYPNLRRWA